MSRRSGRPSPPDERHVDLWELDLERGVCRLQTPRPGLEALQELTIEPMLGCFGVAPPRGQAISTATAGTYGGNMDYRGFTQGITAYFPVFVEGALLHLGDGHAVQGDGEIVVNGIEFPSTSGSPSTCSKARLPAGRAVRTPTRSSRSANLS